MAMPPFLQSFVDGPKLPKVILGVLGLVVIVGGGWFLLLSPVQLEVTALEARRQQLATELAQARAQVAAGTSSVATSTPACRSSSRAHSARLARPPLTR